MRRMSNVRAVDVLAVRIGGRQKHAVELFCFERICTGFCYAAMEFSKMKVKVISRNPDEYMREKKSDIHKLKRNYDPSLHPLESARKYTENLLDETSSIIRDIHRSR